MKSRLSGQARRRRAIENLSLLHAADRSADHDIKTVTNLRWLLRLLLPGGLPFENARFRMPPKSKGHSAGARPCAACCVADTALEANCTEPEATPMDTIEWPSIDLLTLSFGLIAAVVLAVIQCRAFARGFPTSLR